MLFKPLSAIGGWALYGSTVLSAQVQWQPLVPADSSFGMEVPAHWYLSQDSQADGILLVYAPGDGLNDSFRESFRVQRQHFSAASLAELSHNIARARDQNPALASLPDTWVASYLLSQEFEQTQLHNLPGVRILSRTQRIQSDTLLLLTELAYREGDLQIWATYGVVFLRGYLYVFVAAAQKFRQPQTRPVFDHIWGSLRFIP